MHDYWKNHSLDQIDLCWQHNVSVCNSIPKKCTYLSYAIAYLKNLHTLIKNTILLKLLLNESSVSNNHCAGGASWLHGDDGWLMSLLFTEGWEGCDNFLKLENSNICHINWCFLSQFLCWILPTVELLSELKLFLSNLCVALSSVCCTLNLLLSFNDLHQE